MRAENEESEKKRFKVENEKNRFKPENEDLLKTNKHVEGVKSAGDKCVVNEDLAQPAVRAASAIVPLHHDKCSPFCEGRFHMCRLGGLPKLLLQLLESLWETS